MEFIPIHNENLYAVRFENQDKDEYSRALDLWEDLDYLSDYYIRNFNLIDTEFWKSKGLNPEKISSFLNWIVDDAASLRRIIKELTINSSKGIFPDLDSYFKPLNGQYAFIHDLVPQKGYGVFIPSCLRLYSIKITKNCYIIVHGGIKLTEKISGTPELNDALFNKLNKVLEFLRNNGITDDTDL